MAHAENDIETATGNDDRGVKLTQPDERTRKRKERFALFKVNTSMVSNVLEKRHVRR